MAVYTCHNKSCVSIPTLVPDPSTHFVWDEFAIGICCYSPLSHYPWCILFNLPRPSSPPPKKKRKKKRKPFASRITFNFTWVLTTFTKTIMHLVYFLKFALPLPSISLWTKVIPGEIVNNRHILCIYFIIIIIFFFGGGDINRVHYGLCANGEL